MPKPSPEPSWKRTAHGKSMPPEYRIADTMAQLLDSASRDAVRRLMWQMEHGPTLVSKERAATMLAKIAVARPPQRVEMSGALDITATVAETLRAKRAERTKGKADAEV